MAELAAAGAPQPGGFRRRAAYLLVAVAVVAATLVGVLVPHAASTATAAGSVQVVDKAPATDIAGIATALLQGNKIQAPPADATGTAAPSAMASLSTGAPSPSLSTGAAKSGVAGGFFSGLLGGQSMAAAPTAATMITSRGWKALEGAGAMVCRPQNGSELVQMVTYGPCTVITLQPSVNYVITDVMNVTTTKIIVGNPVFLPTLTPVKGLLRLFDVLNGGRLDVRALQLIRGDPERLDEKTLRLFAGSTVRVLLGGSFSASWCILTQPAQKLETFLRDLENPRNRVRTFGGFVLVLGGNVNLLGCIMYRWQPYGNSIVNIVQIGREILLVAGNAVLVGYYSMMGNLMTASINVGNAGAVLGGTLTWVGGAVMNAGVVNAHWGVGQLLFVGGGTMVTVGVHNIGGFLAIFRSGAGQFGVGAGVLLHIGHVQLRAWGVGTVFNAGQMHFCGSGILGKHGENIATTSINHMFAGAGAHMFLGSGDMTWVGVTAGRSSLAASSSGLGGIFYNGGGTTNFIGLPSASFNLVRVRFMLGGDLFHGGGSVEWINYKRLSVNLADAFFGLGTNVFNGGGVVVFVNSQSKTRRRISIARPRSPGAIFVGGTRVPGAMTQKDIVVTGKNGVTVLSNNTKPSMTRHGRVLRRFVGHERRGVSRGLLGGSEGSDSEATHNSLLMIRSSFEEELGGELTDAKQLLTALRTVEGVGQLLDRLDSSLSSSSSAAAAGTTTTATTTLPTQVSIPAGTQCLVCGESAVEQIGEGTCQVSDACTAAKPAEAFAQAQAAATAAGTVLPPVSAGTQELLAVASDDGASVTSLPDLFYLWHELGVYCASAAPGEIASAAACASEAQLKQGLKAWLAAAVGVDSGFSLTAASTAVPAVATQAVGKQQGLLDATHAAPALGPGCTDGFRFHVYVTTVDGSLQQPLQEAWRAARRDPEPLRAALARAGADLCGLTVARKAAIVYPPIERMPPFQPRGLALVGPAVVVGSGAAIAPVDHVVRGRPYTLFLQNFPAGSPVEVRLVGASGVGADGSGLEGVPLTTLASFDDDGETELAWAVPETLAEGRYYMRANSGPLLAMSQPFAVVAAPLTGPHRGLRFG